MGASLELLSSGSRWGKLVHMHFRASCLAVGAITIASAQPKFTTADYQRAEKMMSYNTTPLMVRVSSDPTGRGGTGIRPNWLSDDRFWYRVTTQDGAEFVLVDPAKGTRAPAFDHAKVAAALRAASGRTINAKNPPF